MKKVFDKSALTSFIRILKNYGINFISLDDFVDKKFFKKIKDLKYIHNAKALFNWMKVNDREGILPMIRKFFPTKMEEIETSGIEFNIVDFYFDIGDGKIHCFINQSGRERILKLHTDLYEERTKSEVNKMIEDLRKKASRFYGYFIEETDEESWFITDKNIAKEEYAIKIMSKESMSVQDFELAQTEINIMKMCQHPNIIKLYDIYETADFIYIIMEY